MSQPPAPLECGVASSKMRGHQQSGDLEVVQLFDGGALIAVIDGIGHGDDAASAAQLARQILLASPQQPVTALVQRCHLQLRLSRGVVMSLASIDLRRGSMSWLGVGNVQGILLRADRSSQPGREELLLRSGVVGAQLPLLQAADVPVKRHDTLIFATDGIRSGFADRLAAAPSPQSRAVDILAHHCLGIDDALVLVAQIS
jgi:negative regulator of sigma-B (phosphoserine phosphatase)